jgi:hypothetical protein
MERLPEVPIFFWRICYAYEYDGQNYTSDKYTILHPRYLTSQEKDRVAKELLKHAYDPFYTPKGPFIEGETTVCYVNPERPSEAVLVREYTWKSFVRPIGLPIALLIYCIGALTAFFCTYHIPSKH